MPRCAIILTALALEYQAVQEHLTDVKEVVHSQGTVYGRGRFITNEQSWDVLIAEVGGGNQRAAVAAQRALDFFEAEVALFVGVAGSLKPDDARLGDVVIADKVYGYHSGKDSSAFHPRPEVGKPSYPLLERARVAARNGEWVKRIQGDPPSPLPNALLKPIAAGEQVVASIDSATFNLIREHYNDATAVEMEGSGFLAAIYASPSTNGLVIRGISDLVDNKRATDSTGWQPRAARSAAAFAFEVLATYQAAHINNVDTPTPPKDKGFLGPQIRLAEIALESRERCIALWQAAGVTRSLALEMVDDPSIGVVNPSIIPNTERRVVLLVGGFGSGKSLTLERVFQKALSDFHADYHLPIPVFVEAQKVVGRLRAAVEQACLELGNLRVQGATIIVDGADQTGVSAAFELLTEARILAHTLPNTTILISSRPIPGLSGAEETQFAGELSQEASETLITRIVGTFSAFGWPQPIRDAIRKPLFAILLGTYLYRNAGRVPHSTGELLADLVERALNHDPANDGTLDQTLRRLAVLSTDQGGIPIRINEVAGRDEAKALRASGLIVEREGLVSFPIPVLAQWFAAQSLALGDPSPTDLSIDQTRLERWRYALVIFVGIESYDTVSRIFAPIAQEHPAFASVIVNEALANWGISDAILLPSPQECGQRVRIAMSAWVQGIGPLAQLIAPIHENGTLRPVLTLTNDAILDTGWYFGTNSLPEIVTSPPSANEAPLLNKDWRLLRSARPGRQSAWAWRWSLEDLVSTLSRYVEKQILPVSDGPLIWEAAWKVALAVTGKGQSYNSAIPLSDIENRLPQFNQGVYIMGGYRLTQTDIFFAREHINHLRTQHVTEIKVPWAGPDQTIETQITHWDWSGYSNAQTLKRTQEVFTAAIDSYCQLVNLWFPRLGPRLRMFATLPARLEGIVSRTEGNYMHGSPILWWHLSASPHGSNNSIAISFHESQADPKQSHVHNISDLEAEYSRLRLLRPESREWISASSTDQVLDIFGPDPVTKLTYTWLKSDLKSVFWMQ